MQCLQQNPTRPPLRYSPSNISHTWALHYSLPFRLSPRASCRQRCLVKPSLKSHFLGAVIWNYLSARPRRDPHSLTTALTLGSQETRFQAIRPVLLLPRFEAIGTGWFIMVWNSHFATRFSKQPYSLCNFFSYLTSCNLHSKLCSSTLFFFFLMQLSVLNNLLSWLVFEISVVSHTESLIFVSPNPLVQRL